MNKVLISGLGVGNELGVCDAGNMNYAQILVNPEIVLWADKICIPRHAGFLDSPLDRQGELVVSILDEESNMIERFDDKVIDNSFDKNVFFQQAENEFEDFLKSNPHVTRVGHNEEAFDSQNVYCTPRIASINASLFLANEIHANCLFDASDGEYLQYKSNMMAKNNKVENMNSIFREVLSISLPNQSILHHYGVGKNCKTCTKVKKCEDTYLKDVEKGLMQYLEYRNYDEIIQLRNLIEKIQVHRDELLDENAAEDIIHEIRKRQLKISKRINGFFPKVERFANLSTFVSVPAAIGASICGNTDLALVSGVTAGVSSLVGKLIANYSSKNKWVSFVDRNNNRCN